MMRKTKLPGKKRRAVCALSAIAVLAAWKLTASTEVPRLPDTTQQLMISEQYEQRLNEANNEGQPVHRALSAELLAGYTLMRIQDRQDASDTDSPAVREEAELADSPSASDTLRAVLKNSEALLRIQTESASPESTPAQSVIAEATTQSESATPPPATQSDTTETAVQSDIAKAAPQNAVASTETLRYETIDISESDIDMLARLVWHEARGESFEGQQAVVEVVLNRVLDSRFKGSTVADIIYAPGQFGPAPLLSSTTAEDKQYEAVNAAISGPYVLPVDVVYFSTAAINSNIWGSVGGHIFCYHYS